MCNIGLPFYFVHLINSIFTMVEVRFEFWMPQLKILKSTCNDRIWVPSPKDGWTQVQKAQNNEFVERVGKLG